MLFVFGLPFFAFGAFASFAFFTSAPSVHNNTHPVAGGIFASVFAMIGAAIMVGAVAGYRSQKRDAEVKDRNPNAPWLWRTDRAESRALSNHRNTIYGWWIGTVLTSMLFVPMAAINLPPLLRSSDPLAFFREISFNDIRSVQAAAGVQQSSGFNASYMICLKTRSGSKLTLADSSADREEACSIVAQIEKLAGLKLDTSVVLENFGRDLGPPPQRGSI